LSSWLRNIEATPNPKVVIGSQSFIASHRFLDEEEAVQAIAGYEQRNGVIAPVIRSVLSRFLGWRYRGSASDRRRLVKQLPLIAFQRAPHPTRQGMPHNTSGVVCAGWVVTLLEKSAFGDW
jgi:hypothetical protein